MKGILRFMAILGALILVLGTSVPVVAAPKPINYAPYDVGPKIRQWEATAERVAGGISDQSITSASVPEETPIASKIFLILNDYTGSYQATYFDLYSFSDGAKAQIWVQRNLNWAAGDPRPAPVVTRSQIQYLLDQFENNILPEETAFFGPADAHEGTNALLPSLLGLPSDYYYDSSGRQLILISNIRDNNYYDSTYPIYIAGFYSPSFEVYFDRNVISIDAYDWANRTGPSASRPYLYEGIFAHEYQHLLHGDYDPDEENFINEGMAEFAEIVCGYTAALKGHLDAAAANPENSLPVWEDQGDLEVLTDYGQAGLFQVYLWEQFGQSFIQALFHNPENGISSLNSTLDAFNIQKDFGEVFYDWSIAMLINSPQTGGKYAIKTFPGFKLNVGTPTSPNPEAYNTPGSPPWGTDYVWVSGNPKDLAKLTFNGIAYSTFPTAWTSNGDTLWGGAGDQIDNWAIFTATGGSTLTFDTKYDIEQYWDFGFVQVSTDGGKTWTSLANASTTADHDPNAYPTVIANLPGLTGSTGGEWVNMSFDLSAYSGQDILVAFRYVTDWATTEAGWYIDNVYVDDTLISDGSSVAAFKDITEIVPVNNDFSVTFVGMKFNPAVKGNEYKVATMKLNDVTETGLFELHDVLSWSGSAIMLVTFEAPEGFTRYMDYAYDFTFTNKGPKK